jgi:uncharacterized protein YgbK (DUF1537 family)
MIGISADDITGSNDIGIMFTNGGYTADIYPYDAPLDFKYGKPDVLILNTNSRLDSAKTAYEKVRHATRRLKAAGCRLFFNKTCSVFRGNIGAEFDAMLDELGEEFAVVVLGFPKNGRTTCNGVHSVWGVPLAESEFKDDPIHPMHESNLVNILAGQTKRKVGLIGHTVVDGGPEALSRALEESRALYNYVILDVTGQDSLSIIAQAVQDRYVLCGSSALGEELPKVLGPTPAGRGHLPLAKQEGLGILCTVGSLMPQSREQTACAIEHGLAAYELDTVDLLETEDREAVCAPLIQWISGRLLQGDDVVLYSSSAPEKIARTREIGARQGLTSTQVGKLVSEGLAYVTAECLHRTGLSRFLVAGGETSDAVCSALGIRGMRVWQEIEPGLPSCYSLAEDPRLFMLKSGSFGKPDFFLRAIRHLREN